MVCVSSLAEGQTILAAELHCRPAWNSTDFVQEYDKIS